MSSHATSQPAATVATAPVLSQPLGTHEWQQSLSQHITLFTKQGQQTAELRLHPEDLGQVQISLKLDDNQAQLQMVSAHSHVRAALEAALPVLRSAARASPGSSSPRPSSSTRLRVPATPAVLMKRAMSYCLFLPLCSPQRAVTVP